MTDMSSLFVSWNGGAAFNEDIWDTSGVTSMSRMFEGAAFNQDIGAWNTSGVTSMRLMFYYASAFDQDLGWCLDDDVELGVDIRQHAVRVDVLRREVGRL